MEIMTVVTGAWNAFATRVSAFLPMFIGAIIIFIVGWFIARLVKRGMVRLLRLVRFDKAAALPRSC
jgi:membrane protein DedA with SNARE-associated domain